MKEFSYIITDKDGIHARPAGLLVKTASGFSSEITITKGDKKADAKRIFSVMSLGVKQNESIIINISGEDEDQAANTIETFLKENL